MKIKRDITENMETGLEQRGIHWAEIASTLEIKLQKERKERGDKPGIAQTQTIGGGGGGSMHCLADFALILLEITFHLFPGSCCFCWVVVKAFKT